MFTDKYPDAGAAGKMKLVTYDTRGDNAEAIKSDAEASSTPIRSDAIIGPEFSAEARSRFSARCSRENADGHADGGESRHSVGKPAVAFGSLLTTQNVYRPRLMRGSKNKQSPSNPVIFMDAK